MKLPWGATAMTGIGLAILCTLGTWQVQRLHWKNDIITALNAAYDNGAQELGADKLSTLMHEDRPLSYGAVTGRFLRDKAVLVGPRSEDGRMGYHLLIPLDTKGETLIVNSGWVDDLWKDSFEERLSALPMDDVRVTGLIRKAEWSALTSKNSPENDLWFRPDVAQIATDKGLGPTYPFLLYAESIDPALQDVTPHEQRWIPRNKHLQYAIFWYAMAATLAAVYGVYALRWHKKSVY